MKRTILGVFAATLALTVAQLAIPSAQAFPDRPVRLVISSPPGGPPDIMARLLTDKLAAALGQPIVVENRPGGGGGTVASKSVLARVPGGYTFYMATTSSVLIGPLVHKNAGFTSDSFAPVAGLSETS